MIDQAYRVIKTLETRLAALMEFGALAFEDGRLLCCPFCKASENKTTYRYKQAQKKLTQPSATITTKRIIDHAKDCELKQMLENMEEWGCR
jgi:hypothetical protein